METFREVLEAIIAAQGASTQYRFSGAEHKRAQTLSKEKYVRF